MPNNEANARLIKALNAPEMSDEIEKEIIQAISDGADPACTEDSVGNTALLLSILFKRPKLAEKIIELTVKSGNTESLNQRDHYAVEALNTPLILAIKKGLYDTALSLVRNGADVNKTSGVEDFTPLHFACGLLGTLYESEKVTFLHAFKLFSPFRKVLNAVANKDDLPDFKLLKLIELMLDRGADPTLKNYFGYTPFDLLNYHFTTDDFEVLQRGWVYRMAEQIGIDFEVAKKLLKLDSQSSHDTLPIADVKKFNAFMERKKTYAQKMDEINNQNLGFIEKEERKDEIRQQYADVDQIFYRPGDYMTIADIKRQFGADIDKLINEEIFEIYHIPKYGKMLLGHDPEHTRFTSNSISLVSGTYEHREHTAADLKLKREQFYADFAEDIQKVASKMQSKMLQVRQP